MENTNMPVISAKDLNLWYGDFKALKGISLDVGEREITALIGPSGCGKSTFLKTLNRMNDLVPNVRIEGDVRLKGEDIFAREMQLTDLRRRVGMIMLVDISNCNVSHEELHKRTDALAAEMGMQINVTRQEVFDAMHTI